MKSVIYERDSYWREVCMHCALIVMLVLSTLLSPLVVLAKANGGGLFDGQILHIACNGDATDQSGQNHPVENIGVTFVSDKILKLGRACFFAGNDYLRIANSPDLSLSDFTISTWVLVESEVATYNGEARAIVSNYDKSRGSAAGTYQHYGIGMASSGPASVFYDDGTGIGGAKDVGSSLANGEWHHVTAVFKGGANVELYVDGVTKRKSVGTMPATISPTGDLFIGRGGNSELIEKKWVGSLDDIRIFNHALSATEVAKLSGVVDLPTGETFTPLGTGENDPSILEIEEGPLKAVMVTPNPDGGVSLNRLPSGERKLREGETELPPITSTFSIDSGVITYLDEVLPGMVATVNLAGDLEVTDENIPDLKLVLYRLEDKFTFFLRSDPSVKVKVNHDGTLEIIDENQPHLSILRDNDGNYTIVDSKANTVTLASRNGDAVLSHPDAPGIVATFNIFDKDGNYSLVDTETNECVEIISDGLRGFFGSLTKSVVNAITSSVTSAVGTFAKTTTQSVLMKIAASAKSLASSAVAAGGGIAQWWAHLAPLSKFAIVGGAIRILETQLREAIIHIPEKIRKLRGGAAIAAGAGVVIVAGVAIYFLLKSIKKLRAEVQHLKAVVEQQAIEIANLKEVIAAQAEQINQQAERIAALEDEVARQAEEIAKQAEINAALQDRIADLEDRLRKAEGGVDEIPDGEPTVPTGLKKSSGLRKDEALACIEVPEIPLVNLRYTAARTCQSKVVKVEWETLVELGNAGFNVYRAQKDADDEFINIVKLNDTLIPSQGNGVGENTYLFKDSTQQFSEEYFYGIESVDTMGDTFMFDRKIVKAEECVLATLSNFEAKPANDSISLEWKTDGELNTKGFHLWRAKAPVNGRCINDPAEAGAYEEVVRLSDELISAEGSLYEEASYAFIDESVKSKIAYCYGLEEAVNDGTSIFHWDDIIAATAR